MITPGHVHSSSLHADALRSGSLHITGLLFSRCTEGMTTPSSCHSASVPFRRWPLLSYARHAMLRIAFLAVD
ncbi:MAG: hypothetical protein NTZ39_05430 [Methanoregula sp.]|nr:hypothetical protein [Methanoregula sp.]